MTHLKQCLVQFKHHRNKTVDVVLVRFILKYRQSITQTFRNINRPFSSIYIVLYFVSASTILLERKSNQISSQLFQL